MKIKFKKEQVQDTAVLGVGTLAGTYLSKGIMSIVPSEVNEPIIKAILGIGGFVLGGSIDGKGALTNIVRGILMGVGLENTMGAINGAVAPSLSDTPTTSSQKFVNAMFGMNSADQIAYTPSFMISDSVWNEDVQLETANEEYDFKVNPL